MPAAAYQSDPIAIRSEWIDYNGHLNVGFYHVVFDLGTDQFFADLGLGPDHRAGTGFTTYTAESHARYLREVAPDTSVIVASRLIDLDEKRIHLFQEMLHAGEGWLAATQESVFLSVDQRGETPRVAPFPAPVMANLRTTARAHAALPRPEGLGRTIALKR